LEDALSGCIGTSVWVEDVPLECDDEKSLFPQVFGLLSPESRDNSSKSTLSLSRLKALSRRTIPLVIFGL
jgi:hypothetical protein